MEPADQLPVARVAVDVPLPHLDRPFDYLVTARWDEVAVPGCRVRVRFAGQLVNGYLLHRSAQSDHVGKLAPLERVVSSESVLADEILTLARAVADRYAGTLSDVLRLAIPPRHAGAESQPSTSPALPPPRPDPGPWRQYPTGPQYLKALAEGRAARAVWTALPGPDWSNAIALAVQATLSAGRGALVVVPDRRDVMRVHAPIAAAIGEDHHVVLSADLGPEERYRRWLAIHRGAVRAVVGTRAAMFAPIVDLGLVVLWDDGDDLHAEPHAPYPHVREVLSLRAHQMRAAALFGAFARTAEATQLIQNGWARPLVSARATVRQVAPRVRATGEDAALAVDAAARSARLPTAAWRTAHEALSHGPVLVQVPRRGYLPAIACAGCRTPARCRRCSGPLALRSGHAAPRCRWCGRVAAEWRCPECGAGSVRAIAIGAERTAEELGRAFPGVPVRTSGGDGVLPQIGEAPAIVVTTPGAEPVAQPGYAAALLLDGWALLGRADLRAAEETLRRWMNAAALVRSGAPIVVVADASLPTVQALIRWDPVTHAEQELAERTRLLLPPAVRVATLTGDPEAVRALLASAELPDGAQILGPVAVEGAEAQERMLIRVPRSEGLALARALKAAQAVRSARKEPQLVRVRIDPPSV